MLRINFKQFRLGLALVLVSLFLIGCSTKASTKYWGEVDVPQDNVMRYITGFRAGIARPAICDRTARSSHFDRYLRPAG